MVAWLKTAAMLLLTALVLMGHTSAFSSLSSGGGRLMSAPRSSTSTLTLLAATPILTEWKLLKNGSLMGTVKNHPVIEDGDVVTTSPIENPDGVKYNAIVVTKTGSKYKLGTPAGGLNGKVVPAKAVSVAKTAASWNGKAVPDAKTVAPAALERDKEKAVKEAFRKASSKFGLTGKIVGDSYLLAGKECRSTSGKSKIWSAYKMDDKGFPKGGALTVKLSANIESIKRESENYQKVTTGRITGQFVKFYEYIVPAGTKAPYNKMCALVMERGDLDLKAYLKKKGPLTGKLLREAAVASVQCLQAVHSANLVWTDLKTENFVVQDTAKGIVFRGIDLESAMPIRDNPVDYSPEACPPEFADAFLSGMGPYFVLEYNYDIWSLGMMLYELNTGRSVFEGISADKITKTLKTPEYQVDVSLMADEKLRDLVALCLKTDPNQRPSLTQVLLHPFFLTTGIGPFSF